MAAFFNADGLLVRFGRDQGVRGRKAGVTASTTKRNELVLTVDLAGAAGTRYTTDRNNDGTKDGFGQLDAYLPAGAVIKSFNVINLVTPAGGTSYAVGTFQENGTVDDADGIRLDAGGSGVQVGTQLTAKRYVGVTTVGTYTAGLVEIIVEYVIP